MLRRALRAFNGALKNGLVVLVSQAKIRSAIHQELDCGPIADVRSIVQRGEAVDRLTVDVGAFVGKILNDVSMLAESSGQKSGLLPGVIGVVHLGAVLDQVFDDG